MLIRRRAAADKPAQRLGQQLSADGGAEPRQTRHDARRIPSRRVGRAASARSECGRVHHQPSADRRRQAEDRCRQSPRAQNPRLIYAHGSGYGPLGPDAEQAAFDLVATWTRAGMAQKMTVDDDEPPAMPGSLGDLTGGLAMAGAIAAALFRRERTSIPAVIDVSLLATGMWFMSQSITGQPFGREVEFQRHDRPRQPLVNFYRTKDGRWICLCMLQADRWWPDFCDRVGRPDLYENPLFMTHDARMAHLTECVEELDRLFAERTHDEWRAALAGIEGPWALSQTAGGGQEAILRSSPTGTSPMPSEPTGRHSRSSLRPRSSMTPLSAASVRRPTWESTAKRSCSRWV